MNKNQLAAKIWESANKMRSNIEANEYKDYILGFIFYKYLSEKEENWLLKRDYTPEDIKEYVNEDDPETVQSAQQSLGYFIAYEHMFSTWVKSGSDFSVDNVRVALSSFSRLISPSHKRVFEGIFNTLETGLSKLGKDTKSQTKAVRDLIHLINEIPMGSRKQDYDMLGFIYEFLIEKFASNAGKKAGEFYTPHEVSLLMSEIVADHLKDRNEIKIYDPTSGSGSLLINIGASAAKYMPDANRIRYYAQELKSNTYNLTRMNLVMRGIIPDNIVTRNADTLEEDWPYFDESDPAATYEPLYVDAVVSNPPYSQQWDPKGKENDPRYARYGIAPKSKADYAFLLHELYHLKPDGIMTIVLPHGVLFRGGEEGKIRTNLIENDNIEAIIGLPANIFYGTGIPTIIMVLRQKREDNNVLIIDASKGFEKVGKSNKLRACDIRKIVDTVTHKLTIDKFSRLVSKEEIRKNDYNLNIPRYVDSSEETETWDLYASMFGGVPEYELNRLADYWKVFPSLKDALFTMNHGYGKLKVFDIKGTIFDNVDVQKFIEDYKNKFSHFDETLEHELIDQAETVSTVKEKDEISNDLLSRFENIPLIDKYKAYEAFDKGYEEISGDLELIQSEGMDCVKAVDPNMVLKKNKEVQEGWKGHILPFDLVQNNLLKDELDTISKQEERLQEIPSEYSTLLDELSEDDKETISEALNEENDAFVFKNFKKVIKAIDDQNLKDVLKKADQFNKEEKELKSSIKKANQELHLKTRDTIMSLSNEEVKQLLFIKWIQPITNAINELPNELLKDFASQIKNLSDKYKDTYEDIDQEIKNTEKELVKMLGDLTGDEADMAGIRQLQKMLGGD